jgi:CheY-like chemotaxis protein
VLGEPGVSTRCCRFRAVIDRRPQPSNVAKRVVDLALASFWPIMAIRGATAGMHDKRLLVCDDEPRFGRFVKNVAEDLGYTVCVTTGGQAFIDAYGSFNPTTIVLDMIMPGMDGNELVLWLAQQKSTARLIIITGYTPDYAANAKVLAEYKGLRPVITLRKPVEFYELREMLKSA